MKDKHISREENQPEKELIATISHTLDKSLDDIDDLSLQRLKSARSNALSRSAAQKTKWIPFAVAASFAALVLVPFVLQLGSERLGNDLDAEIVLHSEPNLSEVPLSSEEMDDIEMLMAMEDVDA